MAVASYGVLTVAPPGITSPAPDAPYPISGGIMRVALAPLHKPMIPSSPKMKEV
jgi:hypothetical protein